MVFLEKSLTPRIGIMSQTHGSPEHGGGGTDVLWWRLASHLEESFPFVDILIWKWMLGTEESPESQPCAYKLTDGFARHLVVWLYKNRVCHKLKCRLLSLEKWILLLLIAKEPRLRLWFISKGCWESASSGVCKMILLNWSSYSWHWREILLWNLLIFSEDESEFSVFCLHDLLISLFLLFPKHSTACHHGLYVKCCSSWHCNGPTLVENAEADCTQIEIVLAIKWE